MGMKPAGQNIRQLLPALLLALVACRGPVDPDDVYIVAEDAYVLGDSATVQIWNAGMHPIAVQYGNDCRAINWQVVGQEDGHLELFCFYGLDLHDLHSTRVDLGEMIEHRVAIAAINFEVGGRYRFAVIVHRPGDDDLVLKHSAPFTVLNADGASAGATERSGEDP